MSFPRSEGADVPSRENVRAATWVGRGEGRAGDVSLAVNTAITGRGDDGRSKSRQLLSGIAHAGGLGAGHVGLIGTVGDGDDGGAGLGVDEVLESDQEQVTSGGGGADVVESRGDGVNDSSNGLSVQSSFDTL